MSFREQHRAATHARIVDEATAIISSSGFEGLSMRALAKRVELTPGALYRYFDSQDALIAVITGDVIDQIQSTVTAAVESVPVDRPLLRVLVACEAYRVLSLEQPQRFGLVSMMLAAPRAIVPEPALAEPLVRQMLAALTPLLAAFEQANTNAALRPGPALDRAMITFATLQGILNVRKQATHVGGLFDPETLAIEALCNHFLGWGASEDAVTRARADLGASR
jgi:AcrR family transcriptional regulator